MLRPAPNVPVDAVEESAAEGRDDLWPGVLDELRQRGEAEAEARCEGPGSVPAVGPMIDRPQVGAVHPAEVDRVQDLSVARHLGGCLGVEGAPRRPVAEAACVPLPLVRGELRDGSVTAMVWEGELAPLGLAAL